MTDLATTPAVITPHPVTLDGQRQEVLHVGETVQEFLDRVMGDVKAEHLEVKLGGHVVPRTMWARIKPKAGALLEVRGSVGKQALYIVAMIALTYFTFGIGTAAGWGAGAAAGAFGGGLAGAVFASAVYMAGPARGGRVIR